MRLARPGSGWGKERRTDGQEETDCAFPPPSKTGCRGPEPEHRQRGSVSPSFFRLLAEKRLKAWEMSRAERGENAVCAARKSTQGSGAEQTDGSTLWLH